MIKLTSMNEIDGSVRLNIVMVHGLAGHPINTWRRNRKNFSSFWPFWLSNSENGLAIWTLRYSAPPTNWLTTNVDIKEISKLVLMELEHEPRLRKAPILFICHSLGGILVKYLLYYSYLNEDNKDYYVWFLQNISGIVFLGTPHKGSKLASVASWIWLRGIVQPSVITKQLSYNVRDITELNDWFRTWRECPESLSFYETRHPFIVPIVDIKSADPTTPFKLGKPVDGNHFQICKFHNTTDAPFQEILSFIREMPCIKYNLGSKSRYKFYNIYTGRISNNIVYSYITRRILILIIFCLIIFTFAIGAHSIASNVFPT